MIFDRMSKKSRARAVIDGLALLNWTMYEFWRKAQNSDSSDIEWRFQCWRVRIYVIKSFVIDDVFTTLVSYENYSYFVSSDICLWYLWFFVRMSTIIDFEYYRIRHIIWVGWPVVILSNLLRRSWRIKKEWKRLAVDAYISRRFKYWIVRMCVISWIFFIETWW